jgi:acyl-CoA reductase-like NAD-dependent aldehyde dehydrogenase
MNHFGVHAGILPFNWPPLHTGGKLTSNLAAGNMMILKPDEQAPSTVLWICEVLETVPPKGVIQVVPDMSTEALQILTTHPQVKMVSVASPTPSDAATAKPSSEIIMPVLLELDGEIVSNRMRVCRL